MSSPAAMHFRLRAFGALCAIFLLAGGAEAAELVMYRTDGCPWCARWDREIGPIYPKTDIGRRTPLRMVDLVRDSSGGIRVRSPIRYTPTFVLAENGVEVGRIEGYPGDAFFWGLLERLLERLPQRSPKGVTLQGPGATREIIL
jgi:hypothetical protein